MYVRVFVTLQEELEAMVAGAIAPRKTPDASGDAVAGVRRVSAAEPVAGKGGRRGSIDAAPAKR